jgi:hypothetical protein
MLTLVITTPFTEPKTHLLFPEASVTMAGALVTYYMPRAGVYAVSNDPLGVCKCHQNGVLPSPSSVSLNRSRLSPIFEHVSAISATLRPSGTIASSPACVHRATAQDCRDYRPVFARRP